MATGMLEPASGSEDGGSLLGKRAETTASTWSAWRGITSASSLRFCLAPGFRVQTLEFKSTPPPGPQLPHSHCERVDKMTQDPQFSHLKHFKWFHLITFFQTVISSLRF